MELLRTTAERMELLDVIGEGGGLTHNSPVRQRAWGKDNRLNIKQTRQGKRVSVGLNYEQRFNKKNMAHNLKFT